MKMARFIIFSIIVVMLGSCFSPWNGEENIPSGKGTVSIVWGNTAHAVRSFVQESDLPGFKYYITLTGAGETLKKTVSGVSSERFTVNPGSWTVTVKGFHASKAGESLRVMGIEQIEVKTGPNGNKIIHLYTASEADSWAGLRNIVLDNDGRFREEHPVSHKEIIREEMIIIKNSFNFDLDDETINIIRPIILAAESNVIIGRSDSLPVSGSVYPPFFKIESGGVLTLGKPGMSGAITIDDKGAGSGVCVEEGGIFNNDSGTVNGNEPDDEIEVIPESFTIKLVTTGLTGGDTVSFADGSVILDTSACVGDVISIFYTVTDSGGITDHLNLLFPNPINNILIVGPGSGVYKYTLEAGHTAGGEIIITASSLHTNLLALSSANFTVSDNNPKIYNGKPHGATVTYNDGITSGQAGVITVYYNSSTVIPVNEGIYAITVTTDGGTVYAPAAVPLSVGTLTIDPRPVTIFPQSGLYKNYNDDDPDLGYTSSGGLASIIFTGALSREPGEDVGLYIIEIGTLSAGSNYTLSLSGTVYFSIKPIEGADVTRPTVSSTTHDTITVNESSLDEETGQEIEYNIHTLPDLQPGFLTWKNWQLSTTFTGLEVGTTYYVYARSKSNTNYTGGAVVFSEPIMTKGIDQLYLSYQETGGELKGYIGSTAIPPDESMPENLITLTVNSIRDTITNITLSEVYSGADRGFTSDSGTTGLWAYLYMGGQKIGLIICFPEVLSPPFGNVLKTSFYIGSHAKDYLAGDNDENIIVPLDEINSIFDFYHGTGLTDYSVH